MYTINFCGNDKAEHGIYSYSAIGSLDQVIEGARIKSMQIPVLKYREWIVRITQGSKFVCCRTIKNAKII